MRRALGLHASGEARVIPIIIRPVDWQGLPFSRLQALPKDGKAVTSWANKDEALASVAQGVRQAVEELLRPSPDAKPMIHAMETGSPEMPIVEPTPFRILHLSDLHFDKEDDPIVRLQPLVRDLKDGVDGFGFNELDYLVLSGDLTDRASAEEFDRAYDFVSALISQFNLSAQRCVIVPGNHDLNWDVDVYDWQQDRKVDVKDLKEGNHVKQGKLYGIRDDLRYNKRFENFGKFYHELTQQEYLLKPDSQSIPMLFDSTRIQFLAINSAWEIDEYFQNRSGVNPSALANGLLRANTQVEKAKAEGRIDKDDSVLRIAVWHHPATGNEKIAQDAFLDQLRQEDFKLCLHGHVHEDRADIIGYWHPTRKIHIAGAGTFGATATKRPESIPKLYNLIEVWRDHSKLRIHTRCMKKEGGPWDGWAVWPGEKATERRTYYEIMLRE
jgi:predicted MPP superfamily phosphohydrolase